MEMVCRICLELVTSSCSERVEDVTKEVLKVLLIDVDLSLSDKPVICLRCKRLIGEFCDFKVMCIETEDLLQPYLRRKTNAEVDLKRVYLDSLTSEEAECDLEVLNICRLCMKSKHCEYYALSTEVLAVFGIEEAFLEKFLPELCLSATKSPIICQSCLKTFVSFAKFIMSWSRIEQKINGYCHMTRIGTNGRINIGKIARFIKNVTPGLIPSDEQEDLHFLQCIDRLVKAGHQRRMEELVQPKEENQSEEYEISTKAAAEQLEAEEQPQTDVQKRMEKKKLGAKKRAGPKRPVAAKTREQAAKHAKNLGSKRRTNEQIHTEKPSSLLGPVRKELVVLLETLGSLRAARVTPRENSTLIIEAKKSASTGEVMYFCPECDLTSVYEHSVRRHFFRKHQLFSCAHCPFTTTSKNKLKVHITKFHRLFRCSFCPRTYTTFIGRRIHMNAQHATSSKVFKCKQCNFTSKYQSNLNKHGEMHSERKAVYRCDSCSYSSNYSNNVRRHALVHLDPSEAKMFKCYQCSYDTRKKGDLMHHIKYIHQVDTELLKCPECPFKTKYKACLAKHAGTHDNIVYRCDKCIFRTINKETWMKHCRGNEHS